METKSQSNEQVDAGSHESVPERSKTMDEEFIQERELHPYPNHADDPDTLADSGPKARHTAHKKQFREYYNELYLASKRTHLKVECLWKKFLTAVRPHTVRIWSRANLIEWADLLSSRGVHVENNRSRAQSEFLVDFLYRKDNVFAKEPKITESTG